MRVLLLGDSHTHGAYGVALEKLFKAAGHQVTRVGWVSANASHYLNGTYAKLRLGHTGDFNKDVKGQSFDLAVLSLGTNDAAGTNSDAGAAAAVAKIKQLADSIQATKLYWVGPPAFHPDSARKYNAAFAKDDLNKKAARVWVAGKQAFGDNAIDPRAATEPFVGTMAPSKKLPNGDIHFQKAGGAAWAKFVFSVTSGDQPGTATVLAQEEPESAPAASTSNLPMILAVVLGATALWMLFFRNPIPKATRVLPPIPTPALAVSGLKKPKRRRRKKPEPIEEE